MITTQYRVLVQVPDEVWEKFFDTFEYEAKTIEATKGNIEAGSNSYCEVYEWATFADLKDAQACEKKLMDMNYYFAAKLESTP